MLMSSDGNDNHDMRNVVEKFPYSKGLSIKPIFSILLFSQSFRFFKTLFDGIILCAYFSGVIIAELLERY